MLNPSNGTFCTAFEGARRIASGELKDVVLKAKQVIDRGERAPVLIFDNATSELIEVDFRGTARQVQKRHALQLAAGIAHRLTKKAIDLDEMGAQIDGGDGDWRLVEDGAKEVATVVRLLGQLGRAGQVPPVVVAQKRSAVVAVQGNVGCS